MDESAAQKLCDAFEETRTDRNVTITNFTMEEEDSVVIKKPFWLFTIFWLIQRNFLVVRRDPTIQKLRIVQKMVSVKLWRLLSWREESIRETTEF